MGQDKEYKLLPVTSREPLTDDERELLAKEMLGHGNRKKVHEATGVSVMVLYAARDNSSDQSFGSLVAIREYLHSIYKQEQTAA